MLRRGNRQSSLFLIGFTLALSILAAFGMRQGYAGMESLAAFDMESFVEGQTQIVLQQDKSQVRGAGAEVIGNRIQITSEGTYLLKGELLDGQIYVAAGEDDEITLRLAGVLAANEDDAVIRVENAGRVEIILEEGTHNRLQSGEAPAEDTSGEETEEESQENKGALYARCDLSIGGTGELEVLGHLNNGIHTTKNLVITGGTIQVEAVKNGIKGKESVTVQDGNLTITAGKDGIKSDNETGGEYGVVSLNGGNVRIDSQEDAVQAETVLEVTGGTYQVTAGGGSENAEQKKEETPPRFGGGGGRPEGMPEMGEGQRPERMPEGMPGMGKGEMPERMPEGMPEMGKDRRIEEEEAEAGAKGFKCKTQMIISGGTFRVDTGDDAFHSDGNIRITGGTFEILSGDDGIHADTGLTIDSGNIQIQKSREGLEAVQIWIRGGELAVTAYDDGINACGGNSGFGMEQSGKTKAADEMPCLHITGGSLTVNADGDGLDSNGDIRIDGGEICVNGPSDNGNGAIDIGTEIGGVCEISGGTILAVGSSGMAETFGETSGQYSFCHNFPQSFEAGDEIRIEDEAGNILYTHTAVKTGNSVVFSSPGLSEGKTYTLYAGEQSDGIWLEGISTVSGERGRNFR